MDTKKKKKVKSLLVVLAFIILSGCGGRSISVPEIYTGTQGLEMKFLKDAPPDKVWENQLFVAGLEFANDGPVDIYNAVITLGIEEDYMELMSWDPQSNFIIQNLNYYQSTFDILGKTLINPEATRGVVTMKLKARSLMSQSETHTSLITATACYDYQTILKQNVCIDSDIYNIHKGVKVCEADDISLSSQGSPIVVSKVETSMITNSEGTTVTPHFRMFIRNSGNGVVISSDSVTACSSSSIQKDDVNELGIKAKLFDKRLTCSPEVFRLNEDNEAEVTCELSSGINPEQTAYISVLVVELDYGYTFSISKKVEIKKMEK